MEKRKFFGRASLVATAAMLSGCVTIPRHPIDQATGHALQAKTVASVRHASPDFMAFTPTKAAFGVLGAGAMISAGNAFVRDNGIEDPAPSIADGVLGAIGDKYHMTRVPIKVDPLKDDSVASVAGAAAGADYVLDVQTVGWNYAYLPTGWTRYRVNYVARMRLIDAHTAEIIAEGGCNRSPSNENDTVSFDMLEANRGQGVKDTLKTYADSCVDELKKIVGVEQGAG
jgi:hypothetical protein